MKKLINFFTALLLMTSGTLLLCLIIKSDPRMADGMTAGKVCWFHTTACCLAGSVLWMELTTGKSKYTFSLPDGLLLFLFGVALCTYDKEANLQPEKLLFLGQLTFVWFMLRAVLQAYPYLKLFYLLIIIGSADMAAAWSLPHFYKADALVHPLFREIDYSFRPDLLAAYLAVVLPVCLNMVFRFHNCSKRAWREPRTGLYYWGWISLIVLVFALAGAMNRHAWMTAILSCGWVGWMRLTGWEKTKRTVCRYRISFIVFVLFSILVLVGFLYGRGQGTGDFAGHRLLRWNVTSKAIPDHPFVGTGLGTYPAIYARMHEECLSFMQISSPENIPSDFSGFPFNDYLYIGVELGITGLVAFLLWIGFSFYYGIKHRQIGSCGGILAVGVLGFYSYPLQLPCFWVLLIFFSSIATTGSRAYPEYPQKSYPYVGALAALFACLLFFCQRDMPDTYREWRKLECLYEKGNTATLVPGYRKLYPRLCHKVEFLKEGAVCLSEAGEYSQAIIWLERALELSADRELFYQIALNKQQLGKYREAEQYRKKARPVSTGLPQ